MELEKMSVGELRDLALGINAYEWNFNSPTERIGVLFDELALRLAIKDADLLLEREMAEKEIKNKKEFERDWLEACDKLLKAEAQVKLLVEFLEEAESMLQHTKCLNEEALKCPACSLESRIGEAIAKIKEES